MTENLKVFSKWIDQPYLTKSLKKATPPITASIAAIYGLKDVFEKPKEERTKQAIKNFLVLFLSIGSALIATNGIRLKNGKKLFSGILDHSHDSCSCKLSCCSDIGHEHKHVNDFSHHDHHHHEPRPENHHEHKHESNDEFISFKKVADLYRTDKKKLNRLIPDSHLHTEKEMIEELKKLSLIGLIPVIGGVSGGIIAEKITGGDVKKESKAKIKEGTYQYLSNIVLCNAGALSAYKIMEKFNVKDKKIRFAGMLAGVITFGLIFGGTLANIISKNIVGPLLGDKKTVKTSNPDSEKKGNVFKSFYQEVNEERMPEPLDLGLHIDDIAAVGFLSGVQWIGPVLPALYAISGYRAGIGYRNNKNQKEMKA